MPFWRSWAASLVGASGAAVAVAVGLVLTVVVAAAVSGGGGGFGGLAQLTSGPRIPGVAGDATTVAAPLDGGLPALPRSARRRAARGTRAPSAASPTPADASTSAGSAPSSASTPAETITTSPSKPARPGQTTPTRPTTPSSTPAAGGASTAAAKKPNPLRETVKTLQGAIAPLPVLGPPVADAVGTVADLILPPAGGKGSASDAGAPASPAAP